MSVHVGPEYAGYGIDKVGPTVMVNASSCTERYEPTNEPIVIDLND